MKGQYLGGRPIDVSYSFKKEGAAGTNEKHGGVAERVIAYASMQQNKVQQPEEGEASSFLKEKQAAQFQAEVRKHD